MNQYIQKIRATAWMSVLMRIYDFVRVEYYFELLMVCFEVKKKNSLNIKRSER